MAIWLALIKNDQTKATLRNWRSSLSALETTPPAFQKIFHLDKSHGMSQFGHIICWPNGDGDDDNGDDDDDDDDDDAVVIPIFNILPVL